ncbi:MAG: serine/threonine-protein kinase [Actinoallomurus sp.]
MEALEPGDPRWVETAGRRYHLLARIGSGGMGVVYLGRSASGRTVAVKMVHAEFAENGRFRDRFQREVEVARRVGGGFTAPVIDAGPGARIPWLVSEFLPSVSVRDAVALSGALPAAAVWWLAAGITEALVSIHRAGVIHRDLKPANVLLTADGPRVIDFGIAQAADAAPLTLPGTRAGSPGFMSPEQLAGAAIGPASDIFSLGSTLAYAGTGEEPFGMGAWHETLQLDVDPSHRPTAERLAGELASAARDDGPWLPPAVSAEIVQRRNEAENPPVPLARSLATNPAPRGRGRRRARRLGAAGTGVVLIGAGMVTAMSYGAGGSKASPAVTPTPTPAPSVTPAARTPGAPSHRMRFTVTGDVRLTSLTYTVNGSPTTLKNVRLPWRKTVGLPAWPPRNSWAIRFRCPAGKVSYTVKMDDQHLGSTGSWGSTTGEHDDGIY